MFKKVEKEIKKINRRVIKETGDDISDFLYSAVENYEYDDEGEKANANWIINGLWNEALNYIDFCKENYDRGEEDE